MGGLLDLLSKRPSEGGTRQSGDNNEVEESLDDDAENGGFDAAAQDCYHALKSGDESGFKDALQAAIEMSR